MATKRGPGRPRLKSGQKAVKRMFTLSPNVDAQLDYLAKKGAWPTRSAVLADLIAYAARQLREHRKIERANPQWNPNDEDGDAFHGR